MSRKLFAAGCWVLIATGLAHSLGHYGMVNAQGVPVPLFFLAAAFLCFAAAVATAPRGQA